MKFICILALLSSAAFGSVDLTTTTATNSSIPASSCSTGRVELRLQGLATSYVSQTNLLGSSSNNCGFQVYADASGGLQVFLDQAVGQTGACAGQPFIFALSAFPSGFATLRIQRTLAGSAGFPAFTVTAEAWDVNGNYVPVGPTAVVSHVCTFGGFGTAPANGFTAGNFAVGFIRQYSTLLPLQSTMPVTAADRNNTGCVYSWQFVSGMLTADSCGSFMVTTTGTFVSPGAAVNLVVSQPQSCDTPYVGATRPTWSNWISARVGVTNCMQGTSSFSQAAASSLVTYAWSQTAGASFTLSSSTAGAPTFTPPSFGSYTLHLIVTDTNSNTAATDLNFGAVSMNNSGVVQMPGLAGEVFGQQIAFGRDPWSFYDQKNQYAVCAMVTATGCAGWFNSNFDKTWATLGTGNISYNFAGIGFAPGPACTTLATGINSTATTITVANASCLDLSGLPTTPVWILVGTSSSTMEMIRICSAAANVLTVCYNGRGMSGNVTGIGGYNSPGPAAIHSMGEFVGQMRINGSGTLFGTDTVRPVCPAGLPGPPGPVVSTGTATLTAGSTSVTNFTGSAVIGQSIRVVATHSAVSFVWWAQITNVSGTTVTVNRPFPSDGDTGSYSVKITGIIYLMLQANATDAHVFNALTNGVGCESDTVMYSIPTHDAPTYDSTVMPTTSTVGYSYKTTLWFTSGGTNTPDFYGGACLNGLLYYYRSGDPLGSTLAQQACPFVIRDPETADGITPIGNSTLTFGGPVIGAMACMTTGDCTTMTLQQLNGAGIWSQVEPFAIQGEIGSLGCNGDDTRDTGYETAWLTMAANWDANLTNRAAFTTALGSVLTRDQGCIKTLAQGYGANVAGSFANGFVWAPIATIGVTGTPSPSKAATMTGSNWSGQYTAGTTIAASISTGSRTVTPASMTGIVAGYLLGIDSGANEENVTVDSITGTTFTATFTKPHTGPGIAVAGLPTTNATCYGVDEGTATFTHGSSTFTINTVTTNSGTMTPQTTGAWSGKSPTMIWFNDGSQDGVFEYSFSGTSGQLSGVWTGATSVSPIAFMTTGGGAIVNGGQTIGGLGAIGVDNTDDLAHNTILAQSWACRQTSSTTANLFKVWPGTTGSKSISYYNVQAFGQQPFMLGVKSIQINWARYNSNSTVVSGYAAMQAPVGNWFSTNAWDQINTRGTAYDTIGSACGAITDVAAGSFDSIHSYEGCGPFGTEDASASIARSDSAEGGNAMQLAFIANPTQSNYDALASFYGAIYGAAGTCAASVASTCDGIFAAQLLTLDANKWPGFFFGTGGLFGGSAPALLTQGGGTTIHGPISVLGPVLIAKEVQRMKRFVIRQELGRKQ